jgi:hypothetical protein
MKLHRGFFGKLPLVIEVSPDDQSTNILILRSTFACVYHSSMTTPAADATPTSYSLVEHSGEDQIKQEEDLIKELDKSDALTTFVETCRNIGQRAVTIDNNFTHVKDGFANLIKKYGKDFLRVKSD